MSRQRTVRSLRRDWPSLPAPELADLEGDLEAGFVAPLTRLAPLGLGLIGLPRWFGKRLTADGDKLRGMNLVRRRDGSGLQERLAMSGARSASLTDGLPVVAIIYAADGPRPWRWVRDEFRRLPDGTLAGMTFLDVPGLRRLGGLPFLLTAQPR